VWTYRVLYQGARGNKEIT